MVLGLVMPMAVLLPGPAHADDVPECTGQDRVIVKEVKLQKVPFVVTHAERVRLDRGAAATITNTVDKSWEVEATATGAVKVSGGADWKIAKLDAEVSVSLALRGQFTKRTSVTHDFSAPKRKKRALWVFYHGYDVPKGRWHWISCSRAPGVGVEKWGRVWSWNKVPEWGVIRCKRSLYRTGSIPYQVTTQAGCPR